MLSFDEIEDCFPQWGGTTDDGTMICSAQWLHDFAKSVAEKEREACAKVLRDKHNEFAKRSYPPPKILLDMEAEILMRSNRQRERLAAPARRIK